MAGLVNDGGLEESLVECEGEGNVPLMLFSIIGLELGKKKHVHLERAATTPFLANDIAIHVHQVIDSIIPSGRD